MSARGGFARARASAAADMDTERLLARGAAALAFAGAYLWARATRAAATLHPAVAAHPAVVAAYPGLCESIHAFGAAGDDALVEALMRSAVEIHAHDVARTGAAPWHISRRSAEMQRLAAAWLGRVAAAVRSDAAFRAVAHLREDVVPELERHLETILHNHLLGPL